MSSKKRIILKVHSLSGFEVEEALRKKGIQILPGESLKVSISYKDGTRRKIKSRRVFKTKPCGDGCCSSYMDISK